MGGLSITTKKNFETLVTLDSKVENFKKTEHSPTNHKWT